MKILAAVGLTTLYSLLIRLVFGFMENFMGIMSIAFLGIAPIVIGFLTVYFLPKRKVTSSTSAFFTPWLTCFAVLAITLLFNIEGIICWLMIFPIFGILAGIGGLISFNMKKKNGQDEEEEYKQLLKDLNKPQLSLLLLLPIFLGFIEGEKSLSRKDYFITETVQINAQQEDIWHHIKHVGAISSKELDHSASDIIGFPKHIKTITGDFAVNGKRKAIYEKGLFFDEVIKEIIPYKKLRLEVITQPEKVPPTVMDEHIVIGGQYVDIIEDEYNMKRIDENTFEISLESHFFINTPFNWYAGIWSDYLMRDILRKELKRIKSRAENTIS